MNETQVITQLRDHFLAFCRQNNYKEDAMLIFDIQVAQQNELIILNKKITDHSEEMSGIYQDLKNEPFMKDHSLSKELNVDELKKILSKLNPKGKTTIIKTLL
jgi:hypothetical protein